MPGEALSHRRAGVGDLEREISEQASAATIVTAARFDPRREGRPEPREGRQAPITQIPLERPQDRALEVRVGDLCTEVLFAGKLRVEAPLRHARAPGDLR